MKNLIAVLVFMVCTFQEVVLSQQSDHQQNIHKYITYQAWELVKHQHPEVVNSEMSLRMGNWDDGSINGTGPWQKGKVITGAYREDEEDVVYKHAGWFVSATHFWNADDGDYATFNPPPFTYNYTNSYQKMLAYWYGNVNNNGWLELGPFFYGLTPFYVRVIYNDLAVAYNDNDNFLVTHWYDLSTQTWLREDPPQPLIPYLLDNTTNYSFEEATALVNRVCWEIVGRICHHIEDSGVPAHAHNDPHIISDFFEDIYIPQHFQEYTWADALAQGGLINILNKSYPLRFAIYTSNQIADRFRSDDACGDLTYQYPSQYANDNYESILAPVYQSVQNIAVCEGPESIGQIVADRSFIYTIRSVAGFLWYVYNRFNIQTGYPPVIQGFNRSSADNNFYLGENYRISCIASGTDLNYHWFYKVCDTNTFCNAPVQGLTFSNIGNSLNINNYNFRNSWSCSFYDSLCRSGQYPENNLTPESLELYIGVTVSNQYGQVTRFFGNDRAERIYPKGFIRPPVPPITGCPVLFTHTEDGFKPENNVLHKSAFDVNEDKDTTDKIVLQFDPDKNEHDKSLNFAITETAADIDRFDLIKLISIDHPRGYIIVVNENNDIVMINNKKILSPYFAAINEKNITRELKYDSAFSKGIIGNTKDVIDLKFNPEGNFDYPLGILLDPGGDVNNQQTQKRPPGYIAIFDSAGIKLTEDLDFTRRVRRSVTLLSFNNLNSITNAMLVFKEGFGLTFCAVAEMISAEGLENEHELLFAENSLSGDITKYLLKEDYMYTVIDSTSFITLKFRDNENILPRDWKRDYVMIFKGRTLTPDLENISNEKKILTADNAETNVKDFHLEQNYPNPFNPSTLINYEIPEEAFVTLKIYDINGREVKSLVNGIKIAGRYSVGFDGTNLSSGIYFCKIYASGKGREFEKIRKMVLLR